MLLIFRKSDSLMVTSDRGSEGGALNPNEHGTRERIAEFNAGRILTAYSLKGLIRLGLIRF